jgi:hypothetical protein
MLRVPDRCCKRETHIVAYMVLSYELFSLVHALVVYVSRETCGEHYFNGVVLDIRSNHC